MIKGQTTPDIALIRSAVFLAVTAHRVLQSVIMFDTPVVAATAPDMQAANSGKVVKPMDHPTYKVMIVAAINALKERGGSSRQAILKYIMANYQVGTKATKINAWVKAALKAGVKAGTLKQVKGTGASGSFRVGVEPKSSANKAATKKSKTPSTKAANKKAKPPAKKTKPPAKKTASATKKAKFPTKKSKTSAKTAGSAAKRAKSQSKTPATKIATEQPQSPAKVVAKGRKSETPKTSVARKLNFPAKTAAKPKSPAKRLTTKPKAPKKASKKTASKE